jgi:hypothetical protein
MSDKKSQFIIQIFNVPVDIKRGDLNITLSLLEDFDLIGVDSTRGGITANLTLTTRFPVALEQLQESIVIKSNIHTIQPEDIKVWFW